MILMTNMAAMRVSLAWLAQMTECGVTMRSRRTMASVTSMRHMVASRAQMAEGRMTMRRRRNMASVA